MNDMYLVSCYAIIGRQLFILGGEVSGTVSRIIKGKRELVLLIHILSIIYRRLKHMTFLLENLSKWD